MEHTILIVDDDMSLSNLLRDCLSKEYITATLAHDGVEGLKKARQTDFQLIVLDVMLPELNGFEVLTALRKHTQVPVLMLTAKNDEIDTVTIHGRTLELTGKEFDVLVLLASGSGKVFTKKQIYNEVWREEYAFDDSNIMSYMSKLRKKQFLF